MSPACTDGTGCRPLRAAVEPVSAHSVCDSRRIARAERPMEEYSDGTRDRIPSGARGSRAGVAGALPLRALWHRSVESSCRRACTLRGLRTGMSLSHGPCWRNREWTRTRHEQEWGMTRADSSSCSTKERGISSDPMRHPDTGLLVHGQRILIKPDGDEK